MAVVEFLSDILLNKFLLNEVKSGNFRSLPWQYIKCVSSYSCAFPHRHIE